MQDSQIKLCNAVGDLRIEMEYEDSYTPELILPIARMLKLVIDKSEQPVKSVRYWLSPDCEKSILQLADRIREERKAAGLPDNAQ